MRLLVHEVSGWGSLATVRTIEACFTLRMPISAFNFFFLILFHHNVGAAQEMHLGGLNSDFCCHI